MMRCFVLFLIVNFWAAIFLNSALGEIIAHDSLSQKSLFKAEFRVDIGNILPTNDFVKSQNTDGDGLAHYQAYSLRFARQTIGDKLWEKLYGYPVYGVGIYTAYFKNTPKLGNPIAVYGFFNAPFYRLNKWSLNYELGLGLTFNWNSYDPVKNPNNIALSADKSVYIDAGVSLKYKLNNKMALGIGYGFTHFSNGAIKLPNKGLNSTSAKINLTYLLSNRPEIFHSPVVQPFRPFYEWSISGYGGVRNMLYLGSGVSQSAAMKGVNYTVYGINNTLNKQIDYKSKIGIGITMEFNGSQNSQIVLEGGSPDATDLPFTQHLAFSVYPSYELVIHKLSLIFSQDFTSTE